MPRDMVRGMKGEDVRALQQGLNEYFGSRRPPLNPDGDFGTKTLAALNAFQELNPGAGRRNGGADGIAGRRTLRRLFPLGGYTINIYGMRLKEPNYPAKRGIRPPKLGPGPLRLPGPPAPGPHINPLPPPPVDWMSLLLPGMLNPKLDLKPTKFPGLAKPLYVPPRRTFSASVIPNLLPRPQVSFAQPNSFELAAGGTFATGDPPETTLSLSISAVYVIGKDDEGHLEFQTGFELGSPNLTDKNEGWTFGWFAQFAAVDYVWQTGRFHLAQPYGQLGAEGSQQGPVLKGSFAPLNVDIDLIRGLSVNLQGGFVGNWNLRTGKFTAGGEFGIGLAVTTEIFKP